MHQIHFSLISDAVLMLTKNTYFYRGAAFVSAENPTNTVNVQKWLTCRERLLFGLYGANLR